MNVNLPAVSPFKPSRLGQAVALACLLGSSAAAFAGGTISLGEDKSISLGLGLKTSYTSTSSAAANNNDRSSDFNLDSARLYVSASLSKNLKMTFNTEKDANDNVKVLDAFGSVQFMPSFNIDMGRTIIPSDRANLSGGYYLPAWDFAGTGSQAYSKFASRDDGIVAWGKLLNSKVVYSAGIFQGRNKDNVAKSNTTDSSLFAGRVAVNFWDAEPAPSYLTGSTYYGAADIFTVGVWGHSQKNGVGSSTVRDDYSAWGSDVLVEKKTSVGVFTVEGGYSKYDWTQTSATADATVNTTGAINAPGKSMIGGLAYMYPKQVGWGKFQPFYRYQKFDKNVGNDVTVNDYGLNYLLDGANAKINATYRTTKTANVSDTDTFIVGLQLQF